MSTLKTDNFEELATGDTVPAKYLVHGSAKAWANLDGTGTIALRDSLNVSSITDNGTGDVNINFTSAILAGYSCGTGGSKLVANAQTGINTGTAAQMTTTTTRLLNGSNTGTLYDEQVITANMNGSLA